MSRIIFDLGAYNTQMPRRMMGADSMDARIRMWYEDDVCKSGYLECVRAHEPWNCIRARYLFGNPFTRPIRLNRSPPKDEAPVDQYMDSYLKALRTLARCDDEYCRTRPEVTDQGP